MASIKYNNPNGQKGKVTYNADIVSGIVALSLQETEGIQLVPSKSKGIKLCFEKEGIFVDISVIAQYGYNVPELAYRIQQTIKQMVESMTKYKIAKVDVHVQSVVFPESAETHDEQSADADEQPGANGEV
ncbi:MAG: Asp23/Gls24 family envelope stress response protein [Clostridiales bacterium]|nr:Asp23/Gls24 family envelope stress response protein [Clostridiales bacterium]